MADADTVVDAASGTDLEIDALLKSLRSGRVGRIQSADREIPVLYATIKHTEERIEMYRQDREWCIESIKTLDRHIAAMEE